MKQRFDFRNYFGFYVMQCRNEEQDKKFRQAMDKFGLKWSDGESYLSRTKWEQNKENTVYYFNDGTFGNVNVAIDRECDVLHYNDFSWAKYIDMPEDIKNFIGRFNVSGDVEKVFTNGCCYWFAKILADRFEQYNPTIVYDAVSNHFATKIGDKVYDITGDVTDACETYWEDWASYPDFSHKSRIIADCINF